MIPSAHHRMCHVTHRGRCAHATAQCHHDNRQCRSPCTPSPRDLSSYQFQLGGALHLKLWLFTAKSGGGLKLMCFSESSPHFLTHTSTSDVKPIQTNSGILDFVQMSPIITDWVAKQLVIAENNVDVSFLGLIAYVRNVNWVNGFVQKFQKLKGFLCFKVSSASVKLWNKLENRIMSFCIAASGPVAVACLPSIFNLGRGLCVSCLDGELT